MISKITALRATYFSGSKFSCGHGSDGPKLANELQLWGKASKYIRETPHTMRNGQEEKTSYCKVFKSSISILTIPRFLGR
jgi:hypothetical protein